MGQYDRVMLDYEQMTRRHRAAVFAVQFDIKKEFSVLQGSWQSSVEASASTHDGAGVIDIWLPGMGDNDATHAVTRSIRKVGGGAAWLRGPGKFGGFPWHWHWCDLDTKGMDPLAIGQVGDYRNGGNGLGSFTGNDDPEPWRPDPIRKFDWDDWVALVAAKKRKDRLDDRIEDVVDNLDSLRQERAALRRKIQRLQNH
jgi:hypothetical protein